MKEDFTDITGFLEGLDRPVLSDERKLQMKIRIMSHVRTSSQTDGVLDYLKRAATSIALTTYQKVSMKERILSYVATAKQSRFAWTGTLDLGKRLVGAFLIVAMVMGFFSFAGGNINIASADSFTAIDGLRGDVMVERGGDKYPAYDEMKLEEGDKVYTGEDGWVSIKLLDDSVARLKSGSVVIIDKLFKDSSNKAMTNVEVEVGYGEMWTKVLSLFEEGSSFSVKAGEVEAVAKKASFNVHKDGDTSVIEVYSNVVEMKGDSKSVKVKSGQKVEVKADGNKVVVDNSVSKDDDWVLSNLESDKAHIAKVEQDSSDGLRNVVGSLPESTFYSFKSLKTGVVRFLTFDDVDKQKLDLDVAERKFIEWSVMMQDGKVEKAKAEEVFGEFVSEVEKFKSIVVNVRESGDNDFADELSSYLKGKISETKTFMKPVLPTSPLYPAKEYFLVAEQASAENETEKAIIMKKQATSKLVEVQDLTEVGEGELANEVLGAYVKVSEEAKEGVSALSEAETVKVETALAEVANDESDLITTIEDVKAVEVANEAEVLADEASKATAVPVTSVVAPVQQTADFGVPVTGTGGETKLLDPLLDLNR